MTRHKILKEQKMEKEIVLDLEELKIQEEVLNENFLRMAGMTIELILKQMFGIPIFGPNAHVKGKPKDLKAFAKTLGHEKKYLESAKKHGLNDPKTYKSKSSLGNAVKGFEKATGIKWPFK
jgi:hypothetical protein